jgi:hypothetical protein
MDFDQVFPYAVQINYPESVRAQRTVVRRRNMRGMHHALLRISEVYPTATFTVIQWPSTEPYTTTLTNAQ